MTGASPDAPLDAHRDYIWAVAQEGDDVLIYDTVEEEFGVSAVDHGGVLVKGGSMYGELRVALMEFLAARGDGTLP